jgi:hypothetical protein
MSYDFHFLEPTACDDLDRVHEYLEGAEDVEATPAQQERRKRITEALLRENSALEKFSFDPTKRSELPGLIVDIAKWLPAYDELNGPDDGNGIQISVYATHVTITIPYWHDGEEANAAFDEIARYARVIVREGGYRIYDPQVERVLNDLDDAHDAILGSYVGIVRQIPQLVTNAMPTREPKPWWRFW